MQWYGKWTINLLKQTRESVVTSFRVDIIISTPNDVTTGYYAFINVDHMTRIGQRDWSNESVYVTIPDRYLEIHIYEDDKGQQ